MFGQDCQFAACRELLQWPLATPFDQPLARLETTEVMALPHQALASYSVHTRLEVALESCVANRRAAELASLV